MQENKYNEALGVFQNALASAHSYDEKAAIKYNSAICQIKLGNRSEAEQLIQESLALKPSLAGAMKSDKDISEIINNDISKKISKTRKKLLITKIATAFVSMIVFLLLILILALVSRA